MGSTGKNVRHVYALDLLFFGRVLAVGMVAFIVVVVVFVIVISICNRAAPCPPCKIVLCSFCSIPFHLYAVVCFLLPLLFCGTQQHQTWKYHARADYLSTRAFGQHRSI